MTLDNVNTDGEFTQPMTDEELDIIKGRLKTLPLDRGDGEIGALNSVLKKNSTEMCWNM